ncbi:hypothetical protein ISS03_00715 [Patescibacteria group bacterium]|nr:hypothetical protein [Patescibacteria group bacterium]
MNNEIYKQINILKDIKPSDDWKSKNRELLLSQISSANIADIKELSLVNALFKTISGELRLFVAQPTLFVTILAILMIGLPIVSAEFVNDSKPGDSLYIAKLVSEDAQLAVTFDERKKAKLGLGFAENRTREITKVLVEFNENEQDKDQKVEKLTNDFKEEIAKIKTYEVASNIKAKVRKEKAIVVEDNKQVIIQSSIDETLTKEEDTKVFSAYLGRSTAGIQLSQDEVKKEFHKVLSDAADLIDSKDYVGTLNKLKEANQIILKVTDDERIQEEVVEKPQEILEIVETLQADNITNKEGLASSTLNSTVEPVENKIIEDNNKDKEEK